jgi:hypothetical protein
VATRWIYGHRLRDRSRRCPLFAPFLPFVTEEVVLWRGPVHIGRRRSSPQVVASDNTGCGGDHAARVGDHREIRQERSTHKLGFGVPVLARLQLPMPHQASWPLVEKDVLAGNNCTLAEVSYHPDVFEVTIAAVHRDV